MHGYEMHLDTTMEANVSEAAIFDICAAYARAAYERGIRTAKINAFPRNSLEPTAIFELKRGRFFRTYTKAHGARMEPGVPIASGKRPLPPTLKTGSVDLPIQLSVGGDVVADFDAQATYCYFPAQTMTADCPPAREEYSIERVTPADCRYIKALYKAPAEAVMKSLCDLPIVHRIAEHAAEAQATAID